MGLVSTRRRLDRPLVMGLLVVCMAGCARPEHRAPSEPVASEMPTGGTWQGVYRGTQFGQLHLVDEGERVRGAWRTVSEQAYGELSGEARGNLLTYTWTERDSVSAGGAVRSGTGYFVYVIREPENVHELHGERHALRAGAAIARARKWAWVEPDLGNVRPTEVYTGGETEEADYYMDAGDDDM